MTNIKCTLVGSGSIGKSFLVLTFIGEEFHNYFHLAFDNSYYMNLMYENTMIRLKIQDTCPNETIDTACEYYFPDTNIFIACFSLVNPFSLEKVNFYVDYIKKRFLNSIFILVGLQSDIRDDLLDQKKGDFPEWYIPIETEKGEQKKIEINALDYIECSSMKCYNVQKVFELAIEYSIKYSKQNNQSDEINSCCNIL